LIVRQQSILKLTFVIDLTHDGGMKLNVPGIRHLKLLSGLVPYTDKTDFFSKFVPA